MFPVYTGINRKQNAIFCTARWCSLYKQGLISSRHEFLPVKLHLVDICKQNLAKTINQLNDLREKTESPSLKRLCFITITELQGAQMWLVKSLSFSDTCLQPNIYLHLLTWNIRLIQLYCINYIHVHNGYNATSCEDVVWASK